ncbi:MAG: transglutaminase domain-containing protein [Clostridia bacterium]
MEKKSKDDVLYTITKILILAIICILALFMYVILEKDEPTKLANYNEVNEIVIQNIAVEDTIEKEKIEQNIEKIPIPLIEEEKPAQTIQTTVSIYNNRFYYNQLETISKVIYDEIEKNIENMKSGTYVISLPDEVNQMLKEDGNTDRLKYYVQSAWNALGKDRVDIFFIDMSKITTRVTKTTRGNVTSYKAEIQPIDTNYLYSEIGDKQTLDSMFEQINSVGTKIIASTYGDEYNQILKVHNWLVNNLQYTTTQTSLSDYNIYGALVKKTAVCEGYAEAFKYILDALKIPCIIVSGEAMNSQGETENHAWNYVKLNDKWYAVDVTWDDPVVSGSSYIPDYFKYEYFLKGSQTMSKDHVTDGFITQNGMEFKYPQLELEDYH